MEPAGREAFLSAVAEIRSPAQLALVAGHLNKGDIPRACIALALGPGILGPIDRAMRAAWTAGVRRSGPQSSRMSSVRQHPNPPAPNFTVFRASD